MIIGDGVAFRGERSWSDSIGYYKLEKIIREHGIHQCHACVELK
jgi:hypothetical protein